jgi:hypothetical protein
MRIISVILDPDVINSILSHLKAKGIAPGRGARTEKPLTMKLRRVRR